MLSAEVDGNDVEGTLQACEREPFEEVPDDDSGDN